MEESRKNGVVVSIDFAKNSCQIGYCYIDEKAEPETVSTITGATVYNIPMVLCKREGINQWFYGKDALKQADNGNGILIDNLFAKALSEEKIVVDDNEYEGAALMTLFIKKCLGLTSIQFDKGMIRGLIITVLEMDSNIRNLFNQVFANLELRDCELMFHTHVESFYEYMIRQGAELWTRDVYAYELMEEGLNVYHLTTNQNTKPKVVFINNTLLEEVKNEQTEEVDLKLAELMNNEFQGKFISSVFLLGDTFAGDWAKETIRLACSGRRVFQGNNLYGKGACLAARDRFLPQKEMEYVYLGKDKLKSNIGMRVLRRGKESYYAILDAGQNWFDLKKDFEIIVENPDELEFVLIPLDGSEPSMLGLSLEGLPERPGKATRLSVHMEMNSEQELFVEARDLGFGELYPASYKAFSGTFTL